MPRPAPPAEVLAAWAATPELMALAEHGVHGNGHGLIYEKDSDAALVPILRWLDTRVPCSVAPSTLPK